MKIAVDVGISHKTIEYLRKNNFEIVVIAKHSETDESWFRRGLIQGCNIFISNDFDIARLVEDQCDFNIKWVNFPSLSNKNEKASIYLYKKLTILRTKHLSNQKTVEQIMENSVYENNN